MDCYRRPSRVRRCCMWPTRRIGPGAIRLTCDVRPLKSEYDGTRRYQNLWQMAVIVRQSVWHAPLQPLTYILQSRIDDGIWPPVANPQMIRP
jgi:hypothetical protein